jgi:hypothetical protein
MIHSYRQKYIIIIEIQINSSIVFFYSFTRDTKYARRVKKKGEKNVNVLFSYSSPNLFIYYNCIS